MPNFYWNSSSDSGPYRTTTYYNGATTLSNSVSVPLGRAGVRLSNGQEDTNAAIYITTAKMYLAGYGSSAGVTINVGTASSSQFTVSGVSTTLQEPRAADTGFKTVNMKVGAGTTSLSMGVTCNSAIFFGRWGTTADSTTLWGQSEYIQAPTAPGTPTSSDITSSGFRATWTTPSDMGGGTLYRYIVQISTTSNFSSIIGTYTTANTFYVFSGLSPSSTYYVRVYAGNEIYRDFTSQTASVASGTLTASTIADTVTITFDYQGGSGSPATRTITSGAQIGTLPSASQGSYTFAGWYYGTGGSGGQVSSTTTFSNNDTIYAYWTSAVTFNANGGTNGQTVTIAKGSSINASSYSSTRTGFTFLGWYSSTTGGTQYTTFTPTGAITIYANWQGTVTYDERGGSAVSNANFVLGNSVTLPNITKDGYALLGWYTAASGGTYVGTANQSYTPTASILLYAQWAAFSVSWSDASLNLTARKGQAYTTNNSVAASYVNSWVVSWSPSAPAGLTFTQGTSITGSSTSTLTGTPTVYGSYQLSLTPKNADGVSGQTYTYNIEIADVALSWTGGDQVLSSSIATESVSYTDGVSVASGPTVTYSIASGSLPSGVTLNSSTGAITGTPDPGSAETYDFVIRATNGTGETLDTNTLTITVEAAGGYVKVWTGSAWADGTAYVRQASTWVETTVKVRNASSGWTDSFSS